MSAGERRAIRVRVEPAYDTPEIRAWLETVEALPGRPGAEILHRARNVVTAVRVALADGRVLDLAVKEFRPRGLHRLRTLFGRSKAERAARGAAWLLAAGLRTPAPVAVVERRRRGTVEKAWFAAERVRDAVEIRALFRDLGGAGLRRLLSGLARELRAVHDAGLLHGDLSDGNILVERGSEGSYTLHFLDTNRVRCRRRLGERARAKNLIRLGIPQDRRREFLTLYADGVGPRPSFVRRYERSKAAFERWLRFKKKARLRQWARRLKLQ
jgi:tRNA A-37 threonylcarbamoyl transferase component Bud32